MFISYVCPKSTYAHWVAFFSVDQRLSLSASVKLDAGIDPYSALAVTALFKAKFSFIGVSATLSPKTSNSRKDTLGYAPATNDSTVILT